MARVSGTEACEQYSQIHILQECECKETTSLLNVRVIRVKTRPPATTSGEDIRASIHVLDKKDCIGP